MLLWCLRSWVMEMRRPTGAEARIADMLDRFGAPGAAPLVKGFMSAISQGAARMIHVQCTCCPRIGEDERALLDVLSLAQAVRPFEALLVLHGLVKPDAARAVLRSAEGIGTALAQAGRFLPEPDAEMRHYALAAPSLATRPAEATLH